MSLQDFYEELKQLCGKHNVALDIQAQIVAVDLSSKKNNATEDKESLGLVVPESE